MAAFLNKYNTKVGSLKIVNKNGKPIPKPKRVDKNGKPIKPKPRQYHPLFRSFPLDMNNVKCTTGKIEVVRN